MKETIKLLKDNFIIIDLGSINSKDFPKVIRPAITLITLDAIGENKIIGKYNKFVSLKKAISENKGKKIFYKRNWPECSSFLNIKNEIIKSYNLQTQTKTLKSIPMNCTTLREILKNENLTQIDFLKTDLEGLDHKILTSAPEIIQKTLVIKSELRFQPFFVGEPKFHKTVDYLDRLGFDIITMNPEVWKYPTKHSKIQRDGRLVWADTIFFLNEDSIKRIYKKNAPVAIIKQIIIAKSLKLDNYAEYLFEKYKTHFPQKIAKELDQYINFGNILQKFVNGCFNILIYVPLGNLVLGASRHLFLTFVKGATISKKHPHIGKL